jgi:phage tail-like protein
LGGGITPEQRLRRDPLPAFSFLVDLDLGDGEDAQVFFKSVSGLNFDTAVVPVVSGGNNRTTYKLVGATDWPNLVFRQGFTADSKLLQWRYDWMNGPDKGASRTRIDGMITLLDTALNEKARWSFTRGWPCKWTISEFDASKSELSIETLEIAHNGLTYMEMSAIRATAPTPAIMTSRPKTVLEEAQEQQVAAHRAAGIEDKLPGSQ